MAKELQQAATMLIDINSDMHGSMGELSVQTKVEEGMAYIPTQIILAITKQAYDAIVILQATTPKVPELDKILLWEEILIKLQEAIPSVGGITAVPEKIFTKIKHPIVNDLANEIHDAAMSIMGTTRKIGGCNISGTLDPDEAAAVAKYCSGVLSSLSKDATVFTGKLKKHTVAGESQVHLYPTNIVHALGYHKNIISTFSSDKDAKVAIEYRESCEGPPFEYKDSPYRQEGVYKRLTKEGFTCNVGKSENLPFGKDRHLYCVGEIDKDKLTRLATFFSLLFNADVSGMGKDTADVVSEKAWEYAGNIVKHHGATTYTTKQGQLPWGALLQQWHKDKEIQKLESVYKPLQALALHRDRHHELEEAYGISHGKFSKVGADAIVRNAEAALAVIHEHKWADEGLAGHISHLKSAISQGQENLTGPSDGVGHILHIALNHQLHIMGNYGGCSMAGYIEDTNAGTLAYCEGVLSGTSAIPEGGTRMMHKVGPLTYQVFVIDENPKGGYDVHIPLPNKEEWTEKLKGFLSVNTEFDCSKPYGSFSAGQICSAHIDDFADIRRLAIFLSNLRGASGELDPECMDKAMENAYNVSGDMAKTEGTMAFSKEPIMATSKAWIKHCKEQYGIMPPGLTDAQKKIMAKIGPTNIYAGCQFDSDYIPEEGVMAYCEGVRANPQSATNAFVSDIGLIQHLFHADSPDKITDVVITPWESGYLVELKNMHFYKGGPIIDAVSKKLKSEGFECPEPDNCSKAVNKDQLRQLAYFLSSLHQAYNKTDPNCLDAIVDYASKGAAFIPADKSAHDHKPVYPWMAADWQKEICDKLAKGKEPELAKPPEEVATKEKPKPKPTKFDPDIAIETPWHYYNMGIAHKVIDAVPSPIADCFAKAIGFDDSYWLVSMDVAKLHTGKTEDELKALWAKCVAAYKAELAEEKPLTTPAEIPEELIKKSDDDINIKLAAAMPEWEKAKEIDQYKKLPKKTKDYLHAYMNWALLVHTKDGDSYEKIVNMVQSALLANYPKLTPLMIKLQMDIEKKHKICKGELPAEPGVEQAQACSDVAGFTITPLDIEPEEGPEIYYYENLSTAAQGNILDFIDELAKQGLPSTDIIKQVYEKHGVTFSAKLRDIVKNTLKMHGVVEAEPELPKFTEDNIKELVQMGWSVDGMVDYFGPEMKSAVIKLHKIYKPESITKFNYETLSPAMKLYLQKYTMKRLAMGKGINDVIWEVSSYFNILKETAKPMVIAESKKPQPEPKEIIEALKTLGIGQKIGSCEIIEELDKLAVQNVDYCEGVSEHPDIKAQLGDGGAKVDHFTDTETFVFAPKAEDSQWIGNLVAVDSMKDENWFDRMLVIRNALIDMSFSCDVPDKSGIMNCKITGKDGHTMTVEDRDRIRTAAILLSSIDNVAKLDPKCIPHAVQYAAESAKNKNETKKPWTIPPYPHTVDEWNMVVCNKLL